MLKLSAAWRSEISLFSKLAVPMVATGLLNFSLNLVDNIVVGRYSTLELAGLAAGNSIYYFIYLVLMGLYTSLDMIFGDLFGKKDLQGAVHTVQSALISGLGLSAVFGVLTCLLGYYFELFGSTPEIVAVAKPYIYVMALSIVPSLAIIQLQKFNQVFGNAVAFVWLILAINVVNLILDIIFVFGVEGYIQPMGSLGAGYSSFWCRIITVIAALIMSYRFAGTLATRWQVVVDFSFSAKAKLLQLSCPILRLGLPIALQIAAEVFMFSAATILATGFGKVPASAHQIVLQICSATFMVPLALSSCTSMRVSTLLGEQQRESAILSGWIGIFMATLPMVVLGLFMYFVPEGLPQIFTTDTEVIATAATIMFVAALFQSFDGLQVGAAGALRGIGKTDRPLYGNLIGHYLVGLPLGMYLAYSLDYGIWGLWAGLAAGLAAVSIYNLYYWRVEIARLGRAFE